MRAKDVRNLIITLVIVAIGIKLILFISSYYVNKYGSQDIAGFGDLVNGFTGLGDLAMYGLILLAIILIPYYFSKRSQEKKVQ